MLQRDSVLVATRSIDDLAVMDRTVGVDPVFAVIRIKKEINSASRALLVSSPFPFPPSLRGACNLQEPQRMPDWALFA